MCKNLSINKYGQGLCGLFNPKSLDFRTVEIGKVYEKIATERAKDVRLASPPCCMFYHNPDTELDECPYYEKSN